MRDVQPLSVASAVKWAFDFASGQIICLQFKRRPSIEDQSGLVFMSWFVN